MSIFSKITGGLGSVVGGVQDIFGARNKYKATGVPLQQGATVNQATQAYNAGQGLSGRQTSVADYLAGRMGNANPIDFSAANSTLGTGNQLLQQLVDQGNGVGPNPALAQLQQTTAANINNAAGMAASARGINPALAARMAVNAAGGANQTAAGQAAVMTAEQQLAARQQAAGLVGQQAGQQAGMAQAQAGQQATNINQLLQQLGTMGSQNLSQQQILQQALAQYNNANVQQNLGVNEINAGVAKQNTDIGSKILGGVMQGAGAGLGQMGTGGAAAVVPVPVATGGEITPGGVRRDKAVAQAILAGNRPGAKKGRSDKDVAREILARRAAKFSDGGEAKEEPGHPEGVVDAVARWWHKATEPNGREVAEQVDRKLPEAIGASKAIQQSRSRLDRAYAASQSDAQGGRIQSEKEVAAQILLHRHLGAPRLAAGGALAGAFRGMGDALTGTDASRDPFFARPAAPRLAPQAPAPAADEPASFVGRLFQPAAPAPAPSLDPGVGGYYARGGTPRPVFMSEGTVPGHAPNPGRDTERNDVVPAWLTPGEQVTRRTIATRPGVRQALNAINEDPEIADAASDFVRHLVRSRGKSGGYRRVIEARRRAGGR